MGEGDQNGSEAGRCFRTFSSRSSRRGGAFSVAEPAGVIASSSGVPVPPSTIPSILYPATAAFISGSASSQCSDGHTGFNGQEGNSKFETGGWLYSDVQAILELESRTPALCNSNPCSFPCPCPYPWT
uniref:Uncharacterized protein n=1 Tax=Oryza meridionalis TaxID=40149 RepID=A0A0E0D276_9ORYZ